MSDSPILSGNEVIIPRIMPSYDTGHGDFCFGRWLAKERFRYRLDDIDNSASPLWTDEEMLAGSHNTAFSEIGSFVR
jgi:hypothetical protein